MNPARADKYFGDHEKRELVRGKLAEAFGKLVNSGGNHLLVGAGKGESDPCLLAPLSVDPYQMRACQYQDQHIPGLGTWSELRQEWEGGMNDGSEIKSTHK